MGPDYDVLIPDFQRLAIEWIYDNIAQFGGDTERIILFGQSVGAASADIYSYAVRDFFLYSVQCHKRGLPN